MQKLDVLIIGGGPIGLACGIEAEKNHLDYLILEKGTLTNSLFNYPVNMTFFSTSEKLDGWDSLYVYPKATEKDGSFGILQKSGKAL